MNTDLNSLSLSELRTLQTQVSRAIATFEDRKKKDAVAQLSEKARELGYSWDELTGVAGGRKRSATVPKYRNPANASDTWTGRGRKPRWFEAALRAGKRPEDMAI